MRRLVLLAAAVLAVTETYRRGYAAAVLYGSRQHLRSLDPRPLPTSEPDYLRLTRPRAAQPRQDPVPGR